MKSTITAVIIAAATAALVAGCGETPTETVTTPEPVQTATQTGKPTADNATGDTADAARSYIEALAAESYTDIRAGLQYAAPTSPAYAYLDHFARLAESSSSDGMGWYAAATSRIDGGWEVCPEPSDCAQFTNITVADGRVVEFDIDGEPVRGRITVGDGTAVDAGPATVEFLSAYASRDTLQVTARITSGAQTVEAFAWDAKYRANSGEQRTADIAYAPTEIAPDSSALVVMAFQGVEAGGEVLLEGLYGSNYADWDVTFNVG